MLKFSDDRLQHSWYRAWGALGIQPEIGLFETLMSCYTQPHRFYHTLQHLQECIEQLNQVLAIAEHPGELEIALWFHDAVYEMQRQDNELQSALWAKQAVLARGGSAKAAEHIYTLVLATRHATLPSSTDEQLLVDIDLSILGAAPERFAEYESQVRQEYAWVTDSQFRCQRQVILQQFLDRAAIFSTEFFHIQLEAQARKNLQRSIAQLST